MKELQVITGCMFAGKSTELIRRLKSHNEKFLLVKPKLDNRDKGDIIVTPVSYTHLTLPTKA